MTESALVRLARDGDRGAYDAIVTGQVDHLYRVAFLILRDPDSADDAVQEALVQCWRDLPHLREPNRFDAWLHRILVRSVTDEARRRNRAFAIVRQLRDEPTAPDGAGALADRDQLDRVFHQLSIEQRTVVVLHHYLGFTLEQAAASIGIPVGTAKSRLHYAIESLRAALDADARRLSEGQALA